MPNRRCGLQASVKTSGGIDRSMTEYAADNLVGARIGIEKQLGGDMAEKVGMNPQSCVGADGSRDFGTEKRLILRAAANPREEGRIACRCQMRPKLTDIALEKVYGFRRKRIFEGFSIFDVFGTNDEVQCPAAARPDQISRDIKLYQIAHADRRHQQNLDGNGQLSSYCPSLEILMSPGLAHQLVRKIQ
jgi:hypothetical protein